LLRLFSMFPAGTPGGALLILRISIAGTLLYQAPVCARAGNPAAVYTALSVLGLLLCAGFLTPIVSIVACALELTILLITQDSNSPLALLSGLNTIVAALIGPGAYSVDAKLFGRREITFPPRKGRDS
jgi:uncharacterized membrane protein YphA (DoxX/SURF4 family)